MSKKLTVQIFVFFLLINFVSAGGHFDSHDGIIYFLVSENVVLNHSSELNPQSPSLEKIPFDITTYMQFWAPNEYQDYLKGEFTSFDVPGGILGHSIGVPAYLISESLGIDPTVLVPFLTNSIIISLAGTVLFILGKEMFHSQKIAFVISILFLLTSFVWPYNSSLFLRPAMALVFISAMYFIIHSKNKNSNVFSILAGSFIGLSILVHPSSILWVPAILLFGIIKLKNNKRLTIFLAISFVLVLFIQLSYNYFRYDSLTDFGYSSFQSLSLHNDWSGILGLVFSPGWGLIFYFPIIILMPFALMRIFRRDKSFFFLISYFFISIWLFFGTEPSPTWSGFGGWGPRYFIPFLPFAALSIGYLLKNERRSSMKFLIAGLGVAGFIVNLLGSLVWYMYGYAYAWSRDELWKIKDSFIVMAWDPIYSPINLHVKVLNSDFLQTMSFPKDEKIYQNIGLYPCHLDSYLYCNFGEILIPFLIIIPFLGFLIIRELKKSHYVVNEN